MHHLKLVKGLSYSGAVSATQTHPDVFVENEVRYLSAMKSGYFEEIEGLERMDAEAAEGLEPEWAKPDSLDSPEDGTATVLSDLDMEGLKAYASLNGIDISGRKRKADILAAIMEAEERAAEARDALRNG